MKKNLLLLVVLFCFTQVSFSQISNLKVNGVSQNFTAASGENFTWSFDLSSPGDTTMIQIWIDTDQNGILDKQTDKLWTFFNQIDGDPRGQNGPEDMDGQVNGSIFFQLKLGLAPAHYILLFNNHGHYYTVPGVVNPLSSSNITVTGNVNVPAPYSKQNITVSLECKEDKSVPFWNALTDADGNFSVKMNSETQGTWRINSNAPMLYPTLVSMNNEYFFQIDSSSSLYSGKDFSYSASAAMVTGRMLDENGNPVISSDLNLTANNGNFNRNGRTDTAGVFYVGFIPSELPMPNVQITAGQDYDSLNYVMGYAKLGQININDTKNHDIHIFKVNSRIGGRILINGNSPNQNLPLMIVNNDSCIIYRMTTPEGYFSVPVSDKVFNYTINPYNLMQNISYAYLIAHPGQTNVLLNLTYSVDVKPENNNIPDEYTLNQNYPNPFNPATKISYSIPKEGNVKLTVYNLIGSRVAVLVDEYKPAGNYSIDFNGKDLSSGIYFYKLESGNFTSVKKLTFLK